MRTIASVSRSSTEGHSTSRAARYFAAGRTRFLPGVEELARLPHRHASTSLKADWKAQVSTSCRHRAQAVRAGPRVGLGRAERPAGRADMPVEIGELRGCDAQSEPERADHDVCGHILPPLAAHCPGHGGGTVRDSTDIRPARSHRSRTTVCGHGRKAARRPALCRPGYRALGPRFVVGSRVRADHLVVSCLAATAVGPMSPAGARRGTASKGRSGVAVRARRPRPRPGPHPPP